MSPADTIVALSTASGPSGRMIVRTSGPDALRAARETAPDLDPATAGGSALRILLRFAGVACPGWVYAFLGPRSYTGENLVEYHLPGNPVLARLLLDHLRGLGLRPAEPGEFTARGYFNGRMDLTAAEGVATAVAARSEQELAAARRLLAGELALRTRPVMDALAETLALVEVGIDFADEGVTAIGRDDLAVRVAGCRASLAELLADAPRMERLTHEPTFVLVGRPNAGKSTLLNALAGYERAVTSPVAGTTRDALSAEVTLPHGLARVTDVAGLGDGDDSHAIDAQMRQRALRAAEEADFVVLVHAADDARPPPDLPTPAALVVITKTDLDHHGTRPIANESGDETATVRACPPRGEGLDLVRTIMDQLAFGTGDGGSGRLALNARHVEMLGLAIDALDRAASQVDGPAELAAADLRAALAAVGGILGHLAPDDLLGRIFARFCIGK